MMGKKPPPLSTHSAARTDRSFRNATTFHKGRHRATGTWVSPGAGTPFPPPPDQPEEDTPQSSRDEAQAEGEAAEGLNETRQYVSLVRLGQRYAVQKDRNLLSTRSVQYRGKRRADFSLNENRRRTRCSVQMLAIM